MSGRSPEDRERAGIGGRLVAGAIVGLLAVGAASAFSLAKDAPTTENIVAPTTLADDTSTLDAPIETAVEVASTTEQPAAVAVAPLCPMPEAAPTGDRVFASAPVDCIDPKASYRAVFTTSEGEFTIQLDQSKAPQTVNNFVFLVRKGFYDGLTFHRVIPGFIIQGGDPKANGTGGPGYMIDDELSNNASFQIGTVAMANSGANTNGSQIFIVTGKRGQNIPNTSTIFGRVVKGTKTINAIDKLGVAPTADGREPEPERPITISKVVITAQGEDVKRIPGLASLLSADTTAASADTTAAN